MKPFLINAIFFVGIISPGLHSKAQADPSSNIVPVGTEAFKVMQGFFDYDRGVPLNVNVVEQTAAAQYTRQKIVFTDQFNKRVPGYLAIPKQGKKPFPCILQIHGLTGSKENWWNEKSAMGDLTKNLILSGYAVLSLDAEYHGERIADNDYESPLTLLEKELFVRSRDMMIHSSIAYRRALDYLATRPEIDTSRIGVVGYSMGGIITFLLSAVEPRIKLSIACVTPLISIPYLATSVYNYAPYVSSKSFLMLMGKEDGRNYTEKQARYVYDFIPTSKKEIQFFDGGHILPDEWTTEALGWITTHHP